MQRIYLKIIELYTKTNFYRLFLNFFRLKLLYKIININEKETKNIIVPRTIKVIENQSAIPLTKTELKDELDVESSSKIKSITPIETKTKDKIIDSNIDIVYFLLSFIINTLFKFF